MKNKIINPAGFEPTLPGTNPGELPLFEEFLLYKIILIILSIIFQDALKH